MKNDRNERRTVVMLAGLILVSAAIYLRREVLDTFGYVDAGTPRTIFIVGSAIAITVVSLIAIIVGRLGSDPTERP